MGCRPASVSGPQIVLDSPNDPAHATIRVTGVSPQEIAALRSTSPDVDGWHAIVQVTVVRDEDGAGASAVPPMAGRYTLEDRAIVFTPAFGLDPGRRYAVLYRARDGSRITRIVSVPKTEVAATTVVDHVYPSGDAVPENQLRLYVHFSAPMGNKGGLDYVHLLDAEGREVQAAFLPVDAEFWNADRTRFTMFFDPGRVKRGILPNEQLGRPMHAGQSYTLVVSREWLDANGQPLKQEFRKTFRAGPADMQALDPKTWRVQAPAAGSRNAVTVTFPEPLDHGLLQRALGVANGDGSAIEGQAVIGAGETAWSFTPRDAWRAGEYQLVVLAILEDLAGNRIGRAFEVDQFDRVDRGGAAEKITIPFRVP